MLRLRGKKLAFRRCSTSWGHCVTLCLQKPLPWESATLPGFIRWQASSKPGVQQHLFIAVRMESTSSQQPATRRFWRCRGDTLWNTPLIRANWGLPRQLRRIFWGRVQNTMPGSRVRCWRGARPVRDIVVLNAAAGLVSFALAEDPAQQERSLFERLQEKSQWQAPPWTPARRQENWGSG